MTSESVSESFEDGSESTEINLERFEWVPVREASFRLKVTEKTVYNRIEQKIYTASEKEGKWHVLLKRLQTPTVETSEPSLKLSERFQENSERIQKATKTDTELSEARTVIENLKDELEETKKQLLATSVELKLSQKDNEAYSLLMKEKEKRLAQLEDQVSQEKEHIQAEKSRADMASNQLMNANALIKRRDDAPAQISEPNPEIEILKEKIKELEKAKTPWWKKLSAQ